MVFVESAIWEQHEKWYKKWGTRASGSSPPENRHVPEANWVTFQKRPSIKHSSIVSVLPLKVTLWQIDVSL